MRTPELVEIKNLQFPENTASPMRVFWELNLRCNYNCTNCPPSVHDNRSPFADAAFFEKAIAALERGLKDKTSIHWAFSGGEPTINPAFSRVIEFVTSSSLPMTSFELCTNLSLPTDRLAYLLSPVVSRFGDKTCIVASYHHEYTTPDAYSEKILRLKEKLPELKFFPVLLLPSDPEKFEATFALFDKLKGISRPDLRLIRKDLGPKPIAYSPEQLQRMQDYFGSRSSKRLPSLKMVYDDGSDRDVLSPPELIYSDRNRFRGWSCEAGYSEIVITPDFKVYRASCEKDRTAMGSLLADGFELHGKPQPCARERCMCITDLCINKVKPCSGPPSMHAPL